MKNKDKVVLIGVKEGMFSIDLPSYVVKAIGMRMNAIKLHIMKHDDNYEYFINSKKIESR